MLHQQVDQSRTQLVTSKPLTKSMVSINQGIDNFKKVLHLGWIFSYFHQPVDNFLQYFLEKLIMRKGEHKVGRDLCSKDGEDF